MGHSNFDLATLYIRWLLFLRFVQRRQGFIWRALLAWIIGSLMFLSGDLSSLDARLQIRGNQNNNSQSSEQIELVTLTTADVSTHRLHQGLLWQEESVDLTDNFYWDRATWYELLKTLLDQQPKSIGVSLFFGQSILPRALTPAEEVVFKDPRIIWASLSSVNESPLLPAFASENWQNVGHIELVRDEDGLIRRFNTNLQASSDGIPHISERLSGKMLPEKKLPLINFRGDIKAYNEYSVSEVLHGDLAKNHFQNKIILIGAENRGSSQYVTPLGTSTRHATLAAMTDHLLNERSIQRLPTILYIAMLFLIMLCSLAVMTQVPHSIAVLILTWMGTLWSALSIWIFDSFYFWLPIMSVLGTMISCYVLLLGYQANKIERKHFLLQQEQDYLRELEQLKNNFVSLVSHDLKTPIAKIQAIVDRMSIKDLPADILTDLNALRGSNDEINRYIQSVLQMLRVESREFRLNYSVGEINDVIEKVREQLLPLAEAKNISITTDLDPIFSIEFDQTLIREVLVNLIDNAIKYSKESGKVNVHSSEVGNEVIIEVSDNGIGIPSSELPLIWGKFVRGKDQDLKTKGSGLGLYLVKFFVELHGGRVFAESEPGVGTKIGLALPLSNNET